MTATLAADHMFPILLKKLVQNFKILIYLYYALIYPYLLYDIVTWGNTYETTINPLFFLQKRAIKIMTFSKFKEYSNPLFINMKLLRIKDLVLDLYTAALMFDFHAGTIPEYFKEFLTSVNKTLNYNKRLAYLVSYSFPKVRTNYEKFNIKILLQLLGTQLMKI